jgi:alpha,alpha-trehalose phosphorylase
MALDTWSLEETRFDEEFLARSESLFSIGNGYLGFRGFFCEREVTQHPGVFINGFYELSPIHYGEDAYGFARFNQTMVDLPDCRFVSISVDGNKFSMATEGIESYRKRLDFRTGVLSHEVVWRTPEDKHVDISWNTLLSMEHQHVGALRLVVHCDRTAIIVIRPTVRWRDWIRVSEPC